MRRNRAPEMILEVRLEVPDHVRYRDKSIRVGATVYRAVGCVAGLKEGEKIHVREFSTTVWGGMPDRRETVRSLIYRVNHLLTMDLLSPRRLYLEGDFVSYCSPKACPRGQESRSENHGGVL